MYSEDELLMLSGIQHYVFCRRQWALAYLQCLWSDNSLTVEGTWLHHRTDDFSLFESRETCAKVHALPIASYQLGLNGIADIVELEPCETLENTVSHPRLGGRWSVYPVEFKHGQTKSTDCDRAQVCAQAICLEEVYHIRISYGFLYYHKTKRREKVVFDAPLRTFVQRMADEMHKTFNERRMPMAQYNAKCRNCSLADLCMPKLSEEAPDVNAYLSRMLS